MSLNGNFVWEGSNDFGEMKFVPSKSQGVGIENYFLNRSEVERKFGHTAFLHKLREMFTLAEWESYIKSLNFVKDHEAYILSDILEIINVITLAVEALAVYRKKGQSSYIVPFFFLPEINNLFSNLGIKFSKETMEDLNYFDTLNLVPEILNLIEYLFFPHALLMENSEVFSIIDNKVSGEYVKNYNKVKILKDAIVGIDVNQAQSILLTIENVLPDFSQTKKNIETGIAKASKALADGSEKIIQATSDAISIVMKVGVAIGGFFLFKEILGAAKILKNPPDEKEDLYKYAKRLNSNLNRSDFDKAVRSYKSQHGRLPVKSDLKMVTAPPGINIPIAVEVGKMPSLVYIPPKGRKSPHHYKHDMPSTKLYSDPSGNTLFLLGQTYMDTSDGWLKR